MEEDPLVTPVSNILHSIFRMLMCTSTISKFTVPMDCKRTSFTILTTSREPSLSTKEFCTKKGIIMKNLPMRLWTLPCPNFFTRMEVLSRPDGFMLYGKLGVDFFCTSELLYPNKKIRLRHTSQA